VKIIEHIIRPYSSFRSKLPSSTMLPRLTVYNNVGFGSKERTPEYIYINFILPKVESLSYILPPIVWVYLHSNFRGGLRKKHVFWNRVFSNKVHNGPLRSSKIVDFGTNRKRICDFLLVINSNLGPILPRFRDIAHFLLRRATPPLFHPNFGVFPFN